ncbi:LacI family DNA-binding transcriptional regulator [Vibrio sp. MA40-2]|uniref:LacI family DNA-binding transcriptional regulator n=1 Tax=Vibrio sp. MA40-2 TaxID=3391828 RepID=UPI0039A55AFE
MQNNTIKKPTLKTVAEKLGVSTATVSNAFNRPDQLSSALRDKILFQCNELGYTGPSLTARSLRTGKTGVIGVLLADNLVFNFTDPVATQFLAGIAQTLDTQHANMLLLPSKAENYQNTQVETIPDCFIVYGKPVDKSIIERLERQGKPLIAVDFTLQNAPSIGINNHSAAYEIATHTLQKSQHKALILGLRLEPSSSLTLANFDNLYSEKESISRCRFEGYKKALSEVGHQLTTKDVWQIHDLNSEALNTLLRGALTASDPVDVLLCMSDRIALSALQVAKELNISVPNQLKIVGFDGIPDSEINGLTTIAQPLVEKGRVAAQMALNLVPYESVQLPYHLVKRNTS